METDTTSAPSPHEHSGSDLGGSDREFGAAAQAADVARGIFAAVERLSHGAARSAEPVEAQQSFQDAARALGPIRAFPQLERLPDDAGQEHSVWLDENGLRLWKATHACMFGIVAGQARRSTPMDYLERIILCNEVFGFPWSIEGVWEDPFGRIRIVTTQPVIQGQPGSEGHASASVVNPSDIPGFFRQLVLTGSFVMVAPFGSIPSWVSLPRTPTLTTLC